MTELTIENRTQQDIEQLLATIEQTAKVFYDGICAYLSGIGGGNAFPAILASMARCNQESAEMRRRIEGSLYSQSMFVSFRGDIMRLLEFMSQLVDIMYKSLYQFEIENPYLPDCLKQDFIQLASLSTKSVAAVIPAARAYFSKPESVASKLHRAYDFQKKADAHSQSIKWQVFHNMDTLKLSQKFHLRYFALHIENISAAAGRIADQLSVMSIKKIDSKEEIKPDEKVRIFREFERSIFQRMMYSEELGGLYSEADEVQKDFSLRLTARYPSLSATDKRLATLLRLDFSTKDISSMMNIAPKSVEIARYRLRQKFALNRSDNLVEFIKTI